LQLNFIPRPAAPAENARVESRVEPGVTAGRGAAFAANVAKLRSYCGEANLAFKLEEIAATFAA
jgi:hypothetical protein